nr:pyridine nucleotide-disulfide oxidoreductase [Actinomycetota bacterium]
RMGLVADRGRGVLVGAWIVSPQAGEWIHYVAAAVREETPLERLLDTVAQFPTFSGAFIEALEMLDL